jgi:hypothetical protein
MDNNTKGTIVGKILNKFLSFFRTPKTKQEPIIESQIKRLTYTKKTD